jgi:cytochrome c oxidase cbb3-type subunit I/II
MPMYFMSAISGTLYLLGMLVSVYNIVDTLRNGVSIKAELA